MNRLLVHYGVDVRHPEVSGTEHLEMLQIRDRLAELESTLTSEEQEALAEADRLLVRAGERLPSGTSPVLGPCHVYLREHGSRSPRAGGGIWTL